MKIAYLILCHKSPELVIRLVTRLRFGQSFFVIHIDKRASPQVQETLKDFAKHSADVALAKQVKCYWGNFGIVQATLNCIDEANRSSRHFDYAMLLSGQDFPIRSAAQIHDFLEHNKGKEFIEAFRLDLPNRWTSDRGKFQAMNRARYLTFYLRSRRFQIKYKRKFPNGWTPHGGSQWWCLTKECIEFAHNFLKNNRSVLRFFRHVFIPDEMMFQSLVANSPFAKKIHGDGLHYVDWTNPNPKSPRTLDISDFEKILSSGYLISRKFDSIQSAELLELLDHESGAITASLNLPSLAHNKAAKRNMIA